MSSRIGGRQRSEQSDLARQRRRGKALHTIFHAGLGPDEALRVRSTECAHEGCRRG